MGKLGYEDGEGGDFGCDKMVDVSVDIVMNRIRWLYWLLRNALAEWRAGNRYCKTLIFGCHFILTLLTMKAKLAIIKLQQYSIFNNKNSNHQCCCWGLNPGHLHDRPTTSL